MRLPAAALLAAERRPQLLDDQEGEEHLVPRLRSILSAYNSLGYDLCSMH